MTVLTFDEASKVFGGVVAVNRLSLAIPSGTWCVIVGPNGSGKTTLLELAAGLRTPTSGRVQVGEALAGRPPARAAISYLSDSPAFFSDLTLSEHIEYLAGLFGDPSIVRKATELAGAFNLADRMDEIPGIFSRGMKQKSAICLALARPSSVLLLDEPTRGLDADGVEVIVRVLRDRHRNGTSVITVTHELEPFGTDGLQLMARDGTFATGLGGPP